MTNCASRRMFAIIVAATVLAGVCGIAQAQVGVQEQILNAASYQMPLGMDLTDPSASRMRGEAPRRTLWSDAELKALKKLPGPAAGAQQAIPETARLPTPQVIATNCTTNVTTGFTPSDIHGAAGPTNIITVTNVDIGVYNRTSCAIVSRVSLKSFFATFSPPAAETLFDPRVLYDPTSARFFVTVESRNSGNTDQFQYFAVSQDSSGTTWWLYRIALSQGGTAFCGKRAGDTFWDYPNVGYCGARWFIAGSDFPSATVPNTRGAIISLEKAPSLSGQTVRILCFNDITASHIAPPVVTDTAGTAYFLSPVFGGNSVRRFALTPSAGTTGPLTDTLVETSAISIAAWSAPPNAIQPNGQGLDSLDGRFQSGSIQTGTSLWNVHTVNVSGFARWRLYQFSTTGTTAAFTFTPTTDTGGNPDHLFNPSVAVGAGTVSQIAFVTFSRTIPSNAAIGNAAMAIASGSATSAAGWSFDLIATSTAQYATTNGTEACNNSSRGDCRWGDYSSTQIDPLNSSNAWGFNQLITGTTQFEWTTRGALVGAAAGGGSLVVAPAGNIVSSGNQGGPFSPNSFQYQLSASSGSVSYSITGTPSWLNVSSTSGTVTTSATTITFTVNASANSLTPGTYGPTTITFTNTTNGQGNTTRTATLTVNAVAPANDAFANGTTIHLGQTKTGTNVNATKQGGEPNHAGNAGGKSVWWNFRAPSSGPVLVRTAGSSFDTLLAVYTGGAVNGLTTIASNDDFGGTLQSQVTFNAVAGTDYRIAVDGFNGASGNIQIAVLDNSTPGATSIVAAVAPTSRGTFVNNAITAYVSIINFGGAIATACSIGLPAGLSATFTYQTVDGNNVPTGTPNTPANIAAGATQGFYFILTPTATMAPTAIALIFDCTNTNPAPVFPGINTFLLTVNASQGADVLISTATAPDFQIMDMATPSANAAFSAAAINIGTNATLVFTPTDTAVGQLPSGLPLSLFICQIDPNNGMCINPASPGASSTLTLNTNQTAFFGVFAVGQGIFIPFDIPNNRVFIRATQTGSPVAEGGVAVRMLSGGPSPPPASAAGGRTATAK